MKTKLLSLTLFFSIFSLFAQEDAWVYFKDKPSEALFYSTPIHMLTQRALDRRTRFNIPIDYKDVPVESSYVSAISNATGISIKAKSKWLNALHILGTKNNIDNLLSLEVGSGNYIVDSIVYADKTLNSAKPSKVSDKLVKKTDKFKTETSFVYGSANNQIHMLGGKILHENNFTGNGMQIAVIDAGFPNVDTFLAFKRIRDNNQILGGYDFVNRNSNFYTGYSHGMSVLSTIGGYLENGVNGATTDFVGTAPDAEFYLFITEDYYNETPLEESLWVEAAEKADSLGVDVINTSLGYTTFDESRYDYTYSDMDGKTTFISRGAEIAFSRGMIIVNAAGNEGNNTWHYISAPADGASVLSVGAVNSTGSIAVFSSYGPTSDNRIKPDVCAQGQDAYLVNSSGNIVGGNGTSFSSPILAGLVACLWQAFPNKSNQEITQLVKESAHLFGVSTNQEGYGIPNFETIFDALFIEESDSDNDGVSDIIDECPNTPVGMAVDSNGCVMLPIDNFNIEVIGETCPEKNNAQILIESKTSLDFAIKINNKSYSFTDDKLILQNLEPETYSICIALNEQKINQCYNFTIKAKELVSGKVSRSSKIANFEINNGTPPFTIFLNGNNKMQTSNSIFELELNEGDFVEVKTSIACEGVFLNRDEFANTISMYPNPATDIVKFSFFEGSNELNVEMYNSLGSKVYTGKVLRNNPMLDIEFLTKGFYLVRVTSNNEINTFKVLKN